MYLKQSGSTVCLLLLGIFEILILCHGQPGGFTRAQWFYIQHLNMTHSRCDNAMLAVNSHTGRCKPINTFLHTTYAAVVNVCGYPNMTCLPKPGMNITRRNCHNSTVQVPLDFCNITRSSRTIANCRYSQTQAQMMYVVACDPRSPGDSRQYPIVPVHLDRII
uniref:Ribonuclease A F1 n=1 Tax=Tupaia belangeri TaxID=37347 RepID=W0UV57_TUPBE|nr:TPA: ribonuclease A F1 [Tupaia belangeri]